MGQLRNWMALRSVTDTQSLFLHDAAMSRRAWEGGWGEGEGGEGCHEGRKPE